MGGKSSSITVGYRYYLGIHMVLGWTVDQIDDIVVGDRTLKNDNAGIFPISNSQNGIYINSPELFGGDAREGGIQGFMDVSFGDVQTPNSYLQSILGSLVPAYLNVTSVILNKMHLTSMNPYIKKWGFKVKRTMTNTDGSSRWYSSKADISGQCNPAHIIYEVLTNGQWGMGYPVSSIDDSNFKAAADQFHTEGFGLWIKWSSSSKIKDVISEVQNTTDCLLYQGASSGKFRLKLFRDDYDPETLPAFDESNVVSVDKFATKGWGETVNEITVEYTDPGQRGKTTTITVQDLGNIQMQGSVINQTQKYPAITTGALAARAASRDLRALSVPLAELTIRVNRDAWNLGIGDVFKFSWAKYGIVQAFFRVATIDKGRLTDGTITITSFEDVFSLPDSSYVDIQNPQWSIPNNPPVPVSYQAIQYVGYWDVHQRLSQANIDYLDPDFAAAMTIGRCATTDTFNYQIYDVDISRNTGSGIPAAYGELNFDIDSVAGNIELKNTYLLTQLRSGSGYEYLFIDDEAMRIDAVQIVSLTYAVLTVSRGAMDTVPAAHSADSPLNFFSQYGGFETNVERLSGDPVTFKLLPRTSLGTLAPASASNLPLTLYDRFQRPYPPGYLRINGEYLPGGIDSNTINFTWEHRNRALETADIICRDESHASPVDTDIEYWIDLQDETGTPIGGSYPLNLGTATSHQYDNLTTLYPQMTVLLWSRYIGAGLDSWQKFEHTFLTAGGSQHSSAYDPNAHL